MSEFYDMSDDSEVICPYCGHVYEPEAEDFYEDSRVETCDGCGKSYHLSQYVSVTNETVPDCEINGEVHDFEAVEACTHRFCVTCGAIERET